MSSSARSLSSASHSVATIPEDIDPYFNLEVVYRSHSTDDPTGNPAALGSLDDCPRIRATKGRAKVHPSPEDNVRLSKLSLISDEKNAGSASSSIHVTASAASGVAAITRSSSVFDLLEQQRRKNSASPWKQKLGEFLEGTTFGLVSVAFTVMILYMDLVWVAVMPAGHDMYLYAWTIFAFAAFFIEIFLSSLARPGYFIRFYFWMDLIASFSLVFEFPGFMDLLSFDPDDSNRHITLDRAAKAAQTGARSARIMQVIALMQLLRFKARRIKLYGGRVGSADDSSTGSSSSSESGADATNQQQQQLRLSGSSKPQSRVGEKVTEMTMRKVILGVLILLLVLPVFDANVYYGHPTVLEDGGLAMLHGMFQQDGNTTSFQNALQTYIEENVYRLGTKNTGNLYRLVIFNSTILDASPNLRDSERQTSTLRTDGCAAGAWEECFESKAWVDVRWAIQMQALLDIGRVTFILLVLSVGALLFIRDTDVLVLQPIDRMVEKVKAVSENPLAAAQSHRSAVAAGLVKRSDSKKQLETRVLEHSIGKICSLLSVGFGEAGAEVIADNIRSGGDLNPMVPGRKVRAIFGFCDIRAFTDTTEVLQEEVMEFVNTIANIVHTEVSLHGGAANKNIGDAFLLVWKLPGSPGMTHNRPSRASMLSAAGNGPDSEEQAITRLADAALASFVVIQSALKRSQKLQEYSARSDLNARMPGFAVKMGFGLHVGWAIEGAIGSNYKIDASYLSPHVNMASRLEAATKQFGVSLLLSDTFVALLSPPVRKRLRQVDAVAVKGSTHPIGLFTLDVDPERATLPPGSAAAVEVANAASVITTTNGSARADHVTFSEYPYFDEFEEHPDIMATIDMDASFMEHFAQGFEAYKGGQWELAAAVLEETRVMRRSMAGEVVIDGPSEALLGFIRDSGGVAPAGWQGYRELTEK